MKIYERADFLNLPEGTLFRKGRPYCFGNIQVKASTLGNDFVCMEIGDFEAFDSGDFGNKFEQMLNGESIPMTDDCYGRDGCFDDEEIFLVLEIADLHKLKSIVDEAIKTQEKILDDKVLKILVEQISLIRK